MKGIVVAGTGSGTGKTTIACALMLALSRKYTVQPYKVGPDFIDPKYHSLMTGRVGRNLDMFMAGRDAVLDTFRKTSSGADICVVEGVRGLYEGLGGDSDDGSTAEISKILGLPVLLVVDASSITRSALAIINGFRAFDPGIAIAGVIFNNVSGPQHEDKLRQAVSRYGSVKVVGYVRKRDHAVMGGRHLGLDVPFTIDGDLAEDLEAVIEDIDLCAVEEMMGDCIHPIPRTELECLHNTGLRMAMPLDDSFCFYYEDNLDLMRSAGVKVVTFSPCGGDMLPDADIYYLGGGYPELHGRELSENHDFIEGMLGASQEGCPIIGECGGLMAMCESIVDADGRTWPMIGIFGSVAKVGVRHGPTYTVSLSTSDNPLFKGTLRGHEFHYSELVSDKCCSYCFDMSRGVGISCGRDGLHVHNSVGTYSHNYWPSSDGDPAGTILEAVQ